MNETGLDVLSEDVRSLKTEVARLADVTVTLTAALERAVKVAVARG